jgi:hypothetical protein
MSRRLFVLPAAQDDIAAAAAWYDSGRSGLGLAFLGRIDEGNRALLLSYGSSVGNSCAP